MTDETALSFRDALRSGSSFEVQLSQGVIAAVAGGKTEVYTEQTIEKKDGTFDTKTISIANFIPWLPVTRQARRVTRDGETRDTSEVNFYPEVITRHGIHRLPYPVGKDMLSIKKLRGHFYRAGLVLPTDARGIAQLDNVMNEIGVHDGSRDEQSEYSATGWALHDGRWTYLAPKGGVNSEGLVATVVGTVGNNAEDDDDALPPMLGEIGFDRIAEGDELRTAVCAVRDFASIMVEGHSAPYLLLGGIFAAALPHERQTVLVITGRTGSGKTNVAISALSFLSSARKVTADLTNKPSLVGMQARAVWSRHSVCLWDDYRTSAAAADPEMRKNVSSLIQSHLDGGDSARSNRGRGIGRASAIQSFGIVTSEETIEDEGISNRTLVSHVNKGDVLLTPRDASPYDAWTDTYDRSGIARSLTAAYLRYIASLIEEAGSMRAFQDDVEARMRNVLPELEGGRTAVSASRLAVGWAFFRDFAEAEGIDGLLPDQDDIDAALIAGANDADVAASAANGARRILDRTRDKIASGGAYITLEGGHTPTDSADVLGWELDANRYRPRARSSAAGVLSPDRQYIVLHRDWIAQLARELGITMASPALTALFVELPEVHADSAKEKPSAKFGFQGRPRGVYVRTEALVPDLDLEARPRKRDSRVF